MPSIAALVKPCLLAWARLSANLELIAADRKIGVPEGRVEEWEEGQTRPTIAQLRKAAHVYKRPLGVFFLPEPPQGYETLRDFRRIQGSEAAEWSVGLHDEYRRAHAQREALLEIAELDGSEPSRGWRLAGLADDEERIAAAARVETPNEVSGNPGAVHSVRTRHRTLTPGRTRHDRGPSLRVSRGVG